MEEGDQSLRIREIRVIRGSNSSSFHKRTAFWFRPQAGLGVPWSFSFSVKKGTTKGSKNTKEILEIHFVSFVYFVVPFLGGKVGVLLFNPFVDGIQRRPSDRLQAEQLLMVHPPAGQETHASRQ